MTIAPPLLLLAFDLGGTLFVGLSSTVLEDDDREWMARASAWNQMLSFSWLAACALVLLAPAWAFHWRAWGKELLAAIGVASAWLSRLSGAEAPSGGRPWSRQEGLRYLVKLAPAIFLLTFVLACLFSPTGCYSPRACSCRRPPAKLPAGRNHQFVLEHTPWFLALGGLVILLVAQPGDGPLHQHQPVFAACDVPQSLDSRVPGRLQSKTKRRAVHRICR